MNAISHFDDRLTKYFKMLRNSGRNSHFLGQIRLENGTPALEKLAPLVYSNR